MKTPFAQSLLTVTVKVTKVLTEGFDANPPLKITVVSVAPIKFTSVGVMVIVALVVPDQVIQDGLVM